ncbi:MAG TPA: selenocysteine-specific translation elongation factor, partial [Candidatus Competibacter sp.]|nr:selenocysteine-specific translation elongation factor [Candidatus Competibacter sp.]
MIVGTAGHIDHGKTALVRALTGVDTDRLPEEKARGITIELGYAYQPTESGEILGFVDVPGHERLVHTMIAGATGIDFVLLVVAADDGPMPQTREHVQVLDLLGLTRGAVALTKIDRVSAERTEHAAVALRSLLAGTGLAGSPMFPVSALTGEGVSELRRFLHQIARQRTPRASGARFRLAVDRSFTLTGIGTIVTGTAYSGSVRAGDRLLISPLGREARVRAVHAQNQPAESGAAGQRCALNLAGAEVRRPLGLAVVGGLL